MSPISQPADAIGWPHHNMGGLPRHHLLAAGTQIPTSGISAGHGPHEPLTIGMTLAAWLPADGPSQVERRRLRVATASIGSGHVPIVPARHGCGDAPFHRKPRQPVPFITMSVHSAPSRRSVLLGALGTGLTLGFGSTLTGCGLFDRGTSEQASPQLGFPAATFAHSWAPAPQTLGGLRCLASQRGNQLLLHTKGRAVTFWSGINLGSTTPGHQPGELAISREDYRRWFAQLGYIGARVIRIYTIHSPHMYEELRSYNLAHPDAPLYLIQGIYLPDESYLDNGTLFDDKCTKSLQQEIRDASAAVHATLQRDESPGRAFGRWSADVSEWTCGWLIGVEWDPEATERTDARHAGAPAHAGRFFTSAATATPTERWLAARLDEMATAEAAHGVSAPIAFVNWPTTDPLRHPQEPLKTEDLVSIDANHIVATAAWPGGTFASYHAYPYYPDSLDFQTSYTATGDPYRAYLADLQQHHRGLPVLIGEFGVPSSLGTSHRGPKNRNQGHLTEAQAMTINADLLRMHKDLALAGSLLFLWSEQWFKLTWNTMPRQAAVGPERRALWHDPLSNEQYFGLLAMDSVRAGAREVFASNGPLRRVEADHDASYAYLTLTFGRSLTGPIELGFDIVPQAGLPLPSGRGPAVNDVALVVDPSANSATCLIRAALDPLRLDDIPVPALPPVPANGWSVQRLSLRAPRWVPGAANPTPAEFFDVGRLVTGTWHLGDPAYSNLATWRLERPLGGIEQVLRLRLPWSMLAMSDPSTRTALVPVPTDQKDGDGNPRFRASGVAIQEIEVHVGLGSDAEAGFSLRWDGWNTVAYTERIKPGVDRVAAAYVAVQQ